MIKVELSFDFLPPFVKVDIADEGIDEMEEESQDSLQIDEMDSIKSLIQHFSSRHLLSSWKV